MLDALTYAEWGVDLIKNDDCGVYPTFNPADDYRRMWDGIQGSGKNMIHSVKNTLPIEEAHLSSHMRRVSVSNENEWQLLLLMVDVFNTEQLWRYSKPGFWNDLDMLQIGNGGLTRNEEIAHMALWCALKSPLILSALVKKLDRETLDLLMHDELLSISRDPLGRSVRLVQQVTVSGDDPQQPVSSQRCSNSDERQWWRYDEENELFINANSNKCLVAAEFNSAFVVDCDGADVAQRWYTESSPHGEDSMKQMIWAEDPSKCMTSVTFPGCIASVRHCEVRQVTDFYQGPNKFNMHFNDAFYLEIVHLNGSHDWMNIKNTNDLCLSVEEVPDVQLYTGPLMNNKHLVLLLNRGYRSRQIEITLAQLELDSSHTFLIRDMYARKDIGIFKEQIRIEVKPHCVRVLNLSEISYVK